MSEIHKDTSHRLVTLCKCGEYAPITADMVDCQKSCAEYVKRAGGWCRYYEAGAQMCTHIDEMNERESANKTSNLLKNWRINV